MARSRGGLGESRPVRYKAQRAQPEPLVAAPGRSDHVMEAAALAGLLEGKDARISGRLSPALIKQAKRMSGIDSDTKLIEYALATIALEDNNFAKVFAESRGKVDPTLKFDFFEY